ncbi:hypothetical protein MNBD_GAMMA22-2163 [hydrothermal vent metagenome]|uniref:Uncharacterized protein n=1 Tax=hydrothermal vent metagenome TaxID=652676 RepID=A0A3B0ZR30_9ZZZZ
MNNDLIESKLNNIFSKLSALNVLLCQEKDLLSKSEFEAITDIANQKKQIITAIEIDDIEFKSIITAQNYSKSSLSVHEIIKEIIPSCNKLWLKIENLLRICKDKNSINGIILSNNQRQIKHSIAILQGKSNDILVYGATGESIASNINLNPHLSV